MNPRPLLRGALLAALLAACSNKPTASPDDAGGPAYPSGNLAGEDCDPMVPGECGFPFPSNVYLVDDPQTPTGKHVSFGATTLPVIAGAHINAGAWLDSDGFSPGQAPLTQLPGATTQGLPTQDNLAASIAPGCPTVLLDTSTSPPSLVPHFAELDVTDLNADDQALMIRPVVRLKDATRYIVAIRDVVDQSGTPIPPSPVFQALRDGTASSDPTVASRTALYQDIFARLAAAGIDKSNLQIAWDYTTASQQNNTAQLLSMRDQALAAVGSAGPSYTIVSHTDNPDAYTARRIEGTVHVPLFLDHAQVADFFGGEVPVPHTGFILQRDDAGVPLQNGYGDFEFTVNIPASVATASAPAPVLVQGHGLFGNRYEGITGSPPYLIQFANEYGYVTLTLDLIGWMNNSNTDPVWEDDSVGAAEFCTTDIGYFRRMIDRGTQGIVNELLATRMMKAGAFAADPLVQFGGHSAIDPTRAFYRGDSQGGILGTTFMAVSTDVTRGYLGEPGLPYNLLLDRSADFATSLALLEGEYGGSAMDVQIVLGLMQMFWDRLEGDGFAPYMTSPPLEGTPAHAVFINDAPGDFQVTPLGAHILARAVGAQLLPQPVRQIFDIPDATGPVTGNAIQEYDFGVASIPGTTIPETDQPPTYTGDGGYPDPHDLTRVTYSCREATDSFFRTGVAQNFCTSPEPPDAGPGAPPAACIYSE